MTRTQKALKNIKFTVVGQVSSLLINFLARTLFVQYLGAEYLGLNGLFSNILSILSLAELGIGTAIVYSLYEPLAKGNIGKVKALMKIYKKSYIIIGLLVLMGGSLLAPFLDFFIKDIPDIPQISLIYMLFVINSSITYFFSYKRVLIIADQKKYIDSIYHYSSFFVMNIAQIIILILTRNYLLFLSIKVLTTFFENFLISRKANTMYPFLLEEHMEVLEEKDKNEIKKNIGAMFFHRIGSVVVDGTDNLLISKFVGIVSVGIYSNYLLIITALQTLYNMFFSSLVASVGNLGVLADKSHIKSRYETINLIGYWIFSFSTISLFILLNPFINLWLGKQYVFSIGIVLMICINFYIKGQRTSVLTFRDALGLFWYDRYKPIAESLINLSVSVFLATRYGIMGVFIGTTISTLTTAFWVEPLILYKYGFETSSKEYFVRYLKQVVLTLFVGTVTFILCGYIDGSGISSLIYKMLICLIVPNLMLWLILRNTEEFKGIRQIIKRR